MQRRQSIRCSTARCKRSASVSARRMYGCSASAAMALCWCFERDLRLPGVGDLIERLAAEFLGRAGDRTAAECAIEFHRRLVVRESPHDQRAQAGLLKILARRREQAAAKAETLIFRPQVEFVHLAVVGQAASAVPAIV